MKYTIDWSEEKTTSTGKPFKKVTAVDEDGKKVDANVWSDAPFFAQVAPGATVEAELKVSADGKYTSLQGPKTERTGASAYSRTPKVDVAGHLEVQKEITRNVVAAQDRTAWMWAKNNAAMLVANHQAYKFYSEEKVLDLVEDMATKIYNFEPLTPFND
jgi:hypothetical protein